MRKDSISEIGNILWLIDSLYDSVMQILENEGIDTEELKKRIKEIKEVAKDEQSRLDKTL